jgi:hypothetical protein
MQQKCLVRLVALTLFCSGGSLKVQNFRSHPQDRKQEADDAVSIEQIENVSTPLKLGDWVPRSTILNSTGSVQENVQTDVSSKYFGCNSSSCFVNSKKVETEFGSELILILGCSLDIYAIGYFCSSATGLPMEHFVNSAPIGYLVYCNVGHFTIAYAFHPGASPPPYSQEYNAFLGSTQDIVSRTKNDVMVKFGRAPTAIVVDASLWDVANWWQKVGKPAYPYILPSAYVQQWCNKDVPELLTFVAAVYPNTPIAFRTPPTVFSNPNSFGLSPLTVEEMVHCVELHRTAWDANKIYGTFNLLDYHHFVDNTLGTAGGAASQYYRDSLHPGAQLSLTYMNSVLTWVNAVRLTSR